MAIYGKTRDEKVQYGSMMLIEKLRRYLHNHQIKPININTLQVK